ncbi:hypothetical protein BaRGS_00033239 [Batillaria attramentaria]|uniref:Uncharacterized protein n=1 Tax=Batillaria attramentaria TaxID=370345 RepID=A0ABD0JLA0_9CAEN
MMPVQQNVSGTDNRMTLVQQNPWHKQKLGCVGLAHRDLLLFAGAGWRSPSRNVFTFSPHLSNMSAKFHKPQPDIREIIYTYRSTHWHL